MEFVFLMYTFSLFPKSIHCSSFCPSLILIEQIWDFRCAWTSERSFSASWYLKIFDWCKLFWTTMTSHGLSPFLEIHSFASFLVSAFVSLESSYK